MFLSSTSSYITVELMFVLKKPFHYFILQLLKTNGRRTTSIPETERTICKNHLSLPVQSPQLCSFAATQNARFHDAFNPINLKSSSLRIYSFAYQDLAAPAARVERSNRRYPRGAACGIRLDHRSRSGTAGPPHKEVAGITHQRDIITLLNLPPSILGKICRLDVLILINGIEELGLVILEKDSVEVRISCSPAGSA